MGEVYKARDTRLDRTVAIKVLPSDVSSDPAFRERFDREARAIAALNHPHICTLHDVGQHDGIGFLVLEYLDGETLAQRLSRGALPLDQALRIAIDIADALDKAHRAGIVHRDLKPGNIMLTKAGAKLLDFGLAKTRRAIVTGANESMLPTTPGDLTAHWTILGTLQYMAPEQVEGHDADARTDIFAFGAVLYEMLAGKEAFRGKTHASLIAAILKEEPAPLSRVQPLTPPLLDRVVTTCLAKDPDDRWQTARDLLRELQWAAETSTTLSAGPTRQTSISGTRRVAWAVAAVATLVAIVAVWSPWRRIPAPAPMAATRFAIALPFSPEPGDAPVTAVSISRDGRRILYNALQAGTSQLYLRSLDQVESIPVGPVDGGGSVLSPDGEWIGFFNPRDSTIEKIRVGGGQAIAICDALPGNDRSMTWGANGTIVFAGSASGLMQVSQSGGMAQALTTPSPGEIHVQPSFLPDGRSVLFTIRRVGASDQIAVVDVTNGERRALIAGGSPHFSGGYLVFLRDATIWAAPYDSVSHQVRNDGMPILEGIQASGGGLGSGVFDVAANGTLTYSPALVQERALVWVDRQGHESTVPAPTRAYANLRLSPDGTRVAMEVGTQQQDIWIWDIMRTSLTRFNTGRGVNRTPIWTPDGGRIVFASNREGALNLYSRSADGTGVVDRLTENSIQQAQGSFSPDGSRLVFRENRPETGRDISVLDFAGGRQIRPLFRSPAREENGELSPDGRWVAYESNESGSAEIYVRPFPNTESGRWQVSPNGGTRPAWSRDGRELFWMMPSGSTVTMLGASIDAGPAFHAGTPTRLFSGAYYPAPTFRTSERTYDVSPDGQRFFMIKNISGEDASPESPSLIVVEHWTDDLRRAMTNKQ